MIEISNDNFQEMKEGLVLLDFWSPTCIKCKQLMPEIEELESTYGDKVKFLSLDVTKARKFAIGQGVKGLPNISIYKDGKVVDSVIGLDASSEVVEELIKKYTE